MNPGHSDISSVSVSPESEGKTRFTLRKGEKLRHRSLVDPLFREGYTLYEYPLRLTWRAIDDDGLENAFRNHSPQRIDSLQMLITVPKKKRRHAVDRVLMRRRIREAYRLNRLPLKMQVEADSHIRTLGLALIYLHDKNLPYSTIEAKIRLLFKRLAAKLRISGENGVE